MYDKTCLSKRPTGQRSRTMECIWSDLEILLQMKVLMDFKSEKRRFGWIASHSGLCSVLTWCLWSHSCAFSLDCGLGDPNTFPSGEIFVHNVKEYDACPLCCWGALCDHLAYDIYDNLSWNLTPKSVTWNPWAALEFTQLGWSRAWRSYVKKMEIIIVTKSLFDHGQRHSDLSFGFALSKSRRLSRTKQRSFSIKNGGFT